MENFEKLGAFYLGKTYDLENRVVNDELLLYDSKDLTTHAVCVGMTGSGKTGLCVGLLEEAAIDGVPAIMIDPKGDLANLLLTFPDLNAASFRPWIEPCEATRLGMTADQFAADTARRWQKGLAEWGQEPERIERLRAAAEVSVYTPGSNAGLPLAILRSFNVPPEPILDDADAYREYIGSTTSGLLDLLRIDANPMHSREHILLSMLLDRAWREGRNLDIAALIRGIQQPPFREVGVVDLDTFYPPNERSKLAMSLNNLLASPSFASWMEGEALDIDRLLYTPQGKPRMSILSIAHLSESERMFFVTILLNEVLAWVRSQPGTSSLRALLYMDEIFGYFPPVANPPSKRPMLTLLKQARAFGLGVVLATQNPVDLDYKGLANTGTWFLGRLQTERDKARVLEGLEGAAVQSGGPFDRGKMEATLAGLGKRVFLMNNVHDDEPVVFHTRWVMSYLRGPLTRGHIKRLMDPRKAAAEQADRAAQTAQPAQPASPPVDEAATPAPTVLVSAEPEPAEPEAERPVLPSGVEECYVASDRPILEGCRLVYRPALFAEVKLHFKRATYKIETWEERAFLAVLSSQTASSPWEEATPLAQESLDIVQKAEPDCRFTQAPIELAQSKSFTGWKKQLKDYCYRTQAVEVWKCAALKVYSEPDEAEGPFRMRIGQLAREKRDLKIEKLRKSYGGKLATLNDRIRAAEASVEREKTQYRKASMDSVISIGSSLLGALFGRKLASRTNVSKASSSARSVGSAMSQRGDIAAAQEKLKTYQERLTELEEQFVVETRQLESAFQPGSLALERLPIKPLKSDIQIDRLRLAWTPYHIDPTGLAEPAFG